MSYRMFKKVVSSGILKEALFINADSSKCISFSDDLKTESIS